MKRQIENLFKEESKAYFDFSQSPNLIKLKAKSNQEIQLFEEEAFSRWDEAQRNFLQWTTDKKLFTDETIAKNKEKYTNFFNERGFLKGNILDIGGGWGLYRQWWEPTEANVFVVHDPGVKRFLEGPHKLHHQFYKRAFSLPMTFVEGFGEDLPYRDKQFDTCLIASALDHCIDPQKTLAEIYRCLELGGSILIIQHCASSTPQLRIVERIKKVLRRPQYLFTVLYERFTYKSSHLHHFLPVDITSLLKDTGFSTAEIRLIPNTQNVYAFEAKRG